MQEWFKFVFVDIVLYTTKYSQLLMDKKLNYTVVSDSKQSEQHKFSLPLGKFFRSLVMWQIEPLYTVVHKKQDTKLLSITLPNNDIFSKFFHYYTQQEICNKDIITDSTTP